MPEVVDGPWRTALAEGEQRAAGWRLAAPRRTSRGLDGARSGQRAGTSLEFREHRDYRPGDDLRHVDWAASGRSDRLTVKLFHEEVDPHLDLVVDGSRSMALEGTEKGRAAAALAAFLATAARRAGFTVAAWLAADGCRRLDGNGTGPAGWTDLEFEHREDLAEALRRRPPRLRPRGLRILVSDLLFPADPREILGALGREAVSLVVLQLLARTDAEPEVGGLARLEDAETGRNVDLRLDAAAIERYRRLETAHRERWRRACRERGAVFSTLLAEPMVAAWSSAELADLVRLGVLEAGCR